MTREETKKLLFEISRLYPNFKPTDISGTIDIWASVLADDNFADIVRGLKAYVRNDRSGFAPAPGQLLGMLDDTESGEEAWVKVKLALRDSIYHSEEQYAKLPYAIQKAVGSPQMLSAWAMESTDVVDTSIAKQFKDCYKTISARIKRDDAIGIAQNEQTNKLIGEIGNGGDI